MARGTTKSKWTAQIQIQMSQIPAAGKSNQIKWRPREKKANQIQIKSRPRELQMGPNPGRGICQVFFAGGNGHSFVVEPHERSPGKITPQFALGVAMKWRCLPVSAPLAGKRNALYVAVPSLIAHLPAG